VSVESIVVCGSVVPRMQDLREGVDGGARRLAYPSQRGKPSRVENQHPASGHKRPADKKAPSHARLGPVDIGIT
jgi:hypothetical protein